MKMATKKQPVMEWTDDHDILLLREMIATELFQFKKGSPDRGKIWESIQERLNKLDNPKFMIKEKRGVRDRWNLLQAKFKVALLALYSFFGARSMGTNGMSARVFKEKKDNKNKHGGETFIAIRVSVTVIIPVPNNCSSTNG